MNDSRIIKRIKDLLDMASDVSSPNEAVIAARRARALMDKYQISKHDLSARSKFGSFNCQDFHKLQALWKQSLSINVARLNDCQVRCEHNGRGYYQSVFKGFTIDTVIAGHMYSYLVDTIERLCKQSGFTKRGEVYQFTEHASGAVCINIRKITQSRKADEKTRTGKSLVVVKTALVESHFGAVKYGSKKSRKPKAMELRAAIKGLDAGDKISLAPQVKETGQQAAQSKIGR